MSLIISANGQASQLSCWKHETALSWRKVERQIKVVRANWKLLNSLYDDILSPHCVFRQLNLSLKSVTKNQRTTFIQPRNRMKGNSSLMVKATSISDFLPPNPRPKVLFSLYLKIKNFFFAFPIVGKNNFHCTKHFLVGLEKGKSKANALLRMGKCSPLKSHYQKKER